jgi:hypothetical protein
MINNIKHNQHKNKMYACIYNHVHSLSRLDSLNGDKDKGKFTTY